MYKDIKEKTVLISGATGLIGKALIKKLLSMNCKIVAVVRDINKAEAEFDHDARLTFIISDIKEIREEKMNVDYIIHAAANTSSKTFINDPIGVIETSLLGTKKMLEIARLSHVRGFIFLSTMEVYGSPQTDDKIDELCSSNINTMTVRAAYPESKRMCENMCAAYASQYKVPAKVIRLTQTFGPGVHYYDNRVFAEFARCAIEGRNIVLHTKGETKRSYLYTEDAVNAILTVLVSGKDGEAYNAANEETYCTIYEMAETVVNECCGGAIEVEIKEENDSSYGYAPTLHMNLDTAKIQKLGWRPSVDLTEMFNSMIDDMSRNRK